MDSAESSIKTWLKFFLAAGIPAGAATEYAIAFSDNRMRLDMLADLSKDYLRDLDITVLGDVIAILKHARAVSRQEYKARKIDSSGGLSPSPSPPAPAPAVKRPAPSPAESPASRMVKRLVRQEPAPSTPAGGGRLKRDAQCLQHDKDEDMPPDSKRRQFDAGRLGTPQSQSAPSGSKKTVFDRLGGGSGSGSEAQVSSTTPDVTTRFRVTGLDGPAVTQRAPLHAEASPSTSRQRVTFVAGAAVPPSPPPSQPGGLGYRGVLKPGAAPAERDRGLLKPGAARGVLKSAAASAVKKREEGTRRKAGPVTGTLASDRESTPISARSRIGVPSAATRVRSGAAAATRTPAGSSGVRSRLAGTGPAQGGVKARLGGGGSVRERLGNVSR